MTLNPIQLTVRDIFDIPWCLSVFPCQLGHALPRPSDNCDRETSTNSSCYIGAILCNRDRCLNNHSWKSYIELVLDSVSGVSSRLNASIRRLIFGKMMPFGDGSRHRPPSYLLTRVPGSVTLHVCINFTLQKRGAILLAVLRLTLDA